MLNNDENGTSMHAFRQGLVGIGDKKQKKMINKKNWKVCQSPRSYLPPTGNFFTWHIEEKLSGSIMLTNKKLNWSLKI